jgi:hypothetical protein
VNLTAKYKKLPRNRLDKSNLRKKPGKSKKRKKKKKKKKKMRLMRMARIKEPNQIQATVVLQINILGSNL